jgi:hypothetical protein
VTVPVRLTVSADAGDRNECGHHAAFNCSGRQDNASPMSYFPS